MSSGETTATRTYLEITDPRALRAGRVPDGDARVTRRDPCEPDFWRYLYSTVGAAYHWVDRLPWTDDEIRRYLTDPAVSLWVLTVGEAVAGYFELRRDDDGSVESSVEIAYFGLLPEFTGRGLGGYLLTDAVERAWAAGARRVWLHTCSFDHPFAIQNYLDRGFTVFKTEQYVVARPVI
jgi:ribosomal protein S18 acetylase RimI-like enzyme